MSTDIVEPLESGEQKDFLLGSTIDGKAAAGEYCQLTLRAKNGVALPRHIRLQLVVKTGNPALYASRVIKNPTQLNFSVCAQVLAEKKLVHQRKSRVFFCSWMGATGCSHLFRYRRAPVTKP